MTRLLAIVLCLAEYNPALVPGPAEVAIWALEDAVAQTAAGVDVSGFRYIWIHRRDEADCIEDARAIDLCPVNMVLSKSSNILQSHRVNSRLMRIDLNRLGVTPERSKKLAETWEQLRDLDRYITASENSLAVTTVEVIEEANVKIESTVVRLAKPGETLTLGPASTDPAWVSVMVDGKQAFIKSSAVKVPKAGESRGIGPQCGEAGQDLAELVRSEIPIVRHDFLLRAACTGDFVLRPVGREGGLYYDFLQVGRGSGQRTDLDEWLAVAGADLKESQRLRTDVGSVIVRSNVTGRSRVAVAIRGRGGKPGTSDGVVFGTFDGKVGDEFDPGNRDPWENLLAFQHQASEWIGPLPNGLHYYGLFSGDIADPKFARQDFAPDDVANDDTVPNPHSDRIIVGMCWRCHNRGEKEDGLKTFGNDLATLLNRGQDIIVADPVEADTIASRYTGDFERIMQESRDSFARAVFRATRDPEHRLEGMTPNVAFGRLADIYQAYYYDLVTTDTALLDLGVIPAAADQSAEQFRSLVNIRAVGEAAPLVLLASGVAVNRWQWEEVYAEAYLRARTEGKIEEKKEEAVQ